MREESRSFDSGSKVLGPAPLSRCSLSMGGDFLHDPWPGPTMGEIMAHPFGQDELGSRDGLGDPSHGHAANMGLIDSEGIDQA